MLHKVWFRKLDGWWYVTLKEGGERKQIKLAKAPKTAEGRKLGETQLIKELEERQHQDEEPESPSWLLVEHVLDGFLKHSKEEHEPATWQWYEGFFNTFKPLFGRLRIRQLRRKHVMAWVKKRAFNQTTQNRAIGAIKRAFQWAVEEEYIARSPIAHVRKPRSVVRDRNLTADERALILGSIPDDQFRDYITTLGLTGCRPGEVARVTSQDVNLEHGIWILQKHKTARATGKPRVIYLCAEALAITKKLMAKWPEGPIFRNTRGEPWTKNAVRIRFGKLREKHPELKGVTAYTYRSSFATDALEHGVSDATVAALLGHTNTNTLHRFYARLSHKVQHLKDAVKKATQPPAAGAVRPDTAA